MTSNAFHGISPSDAFRELLQSFEDRISKIENRYYYRSEDTQEQALNLEEWLRTNDSPPVTEKDIDDIRSKLIILDISEDHVEIRSRAQMGSTVTTNYKDLKSLIYVCREHLACSVPILLAYIDKVKKENPQKFLNNFENPEPEHVKSKKEPHPLSSRLRIVEIMGRLVKLQVIEGDAFFMTIIDTDQPKSLDFFCNHFFECQVSDFLEFVENHKARLWEDKGKTI